MLFRVCVICIYRFTSSWNHQRKIFPYYLRKFVHFSLFKLSVAVCGNMQDQFLWPRKLCCSCNDQTLKFVLRTLRVTATTFTTWTCSCNLSARLTYLCSQYYAWNFKSLHFRRLLSVAKLLLLHGGSNSVEHKNEWYSKTESKLKRCNLVSIVRFCLLVKGYKRSAVWNCSFLWKFIIFKPWTLCLAPRILICNLFLSYVDHFLRGRDNCNPQTMFRVFV